MSLGSVLLPADWLQVLRHFFFSGRWRDRRLNFPKRPEGDIRAASVEGRFVLPTFSKFGYDFPAKPENYEHVKMFWKLSAPLLEQGKVKPHPVDIRPGGFEGMIQGWVFPVYVVDV